MRASALARRKVSRQITHTGPSAEVDLTKFLGRVFIPGRAPPAAGERSPRALRLLGALDGLEGLLLLRSKEPAPTEARGASRRRSSS